MSLADLTCIPCRGDLPRMTRAQLKPLLPQIARWKVVNHKRHPHHLMREVEFPDFASLRVGYSYFPEGTVVRWLVRQAAVTAATGEFVTIGGGGANHFVTILLGTELALSAEAADVDFTWDIGGVPFGYSVRRNPAV